VGELYLVFFAVGLLVFAGIVAYSIAEQRKQERGENDTYVDPLFAELEKSKEQAANANKARLDSKASLAAEKSAPVAPNLLDDSESDKHELIGDARAAEELRRGGRTAPSLDDPASKKERPKSRTQEMGSSGKKTVSSSAVTESGKHGELNPNEKNPRPEELAELSDTNKNSDVHQAKLAPKPQVDNESESIVTELVARINNPEAIEQQELLALFRKHDFKFHRQVHIYGLNQLTDMWRDIEFELPSARFVELGISLQLADREGAMSQKELHDFQQMVLEFTNQFDAPFEFSMNIDDALKQALALDQIGRRYDSMAVLNVVPKSKSGFRMADIESCARDLMMSTDKNGIFMKTRGQKNNITVLFRLACTDGSGQFGISSGSSTPVHDLVVYMNVPATEDPEMVFQEMVKDANSLATWLEGKVVDRQG